jgi:hypothetical protein
MTLKEALEKRREACEFEYQFDDHIKLLSKIILKQDKALKDSIIVESECDECGTYSNVRYGLKEIKDTKSEILKMLQPENER